MLISLLIVSIRSLEPWTQGGFESKKYRNLFAELGYSQSEIDAKLQQLFSDVFEGPNKVYFEVGSDQGYVSDLKNNDVRTEGQSYGMMLAVQFGKKDIFDRLWRWATKNMQHHSGDYEGYFAWSLKTDGTKNSEGPASDGELYFITALIFASNLWGNDGEINYLKEAQYILSCATSKDAKNGYVTNLIDDSHRLITFVPDGYGNKFTDPSYNIPAFYEVWAKWANDGKSSYWQDCASKARQFLHSTVHSTTGLTPDYANYDGSPHGGGTIGEAFRFDSWRVPMNIALDFSWANADSSWQTQYGERIQNFLYSKGIDDYVDQYNIDGSTVREILGAGGKTKLRHSLGLVSTAAAVSLCVTHEKAKEFVDQFWNAKNQPYDDGYFDAYFDGILQLFAFMHLSGNYKVIFPAQR